MNQMSTLRRCVSNGAGYAKTMLEDVTRWNERRIWAEYCEATKDFPPRDLTVKALEYVHAKDRALDLGPGAMNESRFLLENGFAFVTAVNIDPPKGNAVVSERIAQFPNDRFEFVVSAFDKFDFEPDMYDLINAQRSLPFNPPKTFDRMFTSLLASLKPGGILTGCFFGVEHKWRNNRKMTFVTRERAGELLKDCEIVLFTEHQRPHDESETANPHWHEFDFIVRKK